MDEKGAPRTSTIRLPLGPYHPTLALPLDLTLRLRGETIEGLAPVGTGYACRGIAALAVGRPIDEALLIVERACSLAHESYRIALCMAAEAATNTAVPLIAQRVRLLYAEIERILARLWNLVQIARAAGDHEAEADALEQREALFEALQAATGRRHYWAVSVPGGVRENLDATPLKHVLGAFDRALEAWRARVAPAGRLGRICRDLGPLNAERAAKLGLTGIVARGSRPIEDLRRARPYGAYDANTAALKVTDRKLGGDVAARLVCIIEDVGTSLSLARPVADELAAATLPAVRAAPGEAQPGAISLGAVEGPHGPIEVAVTLAGADSLAQLRLSAPGAATLAALPELLEGRSLAQASVILASLDLCIECLDL
jgi:membrane-bound hydrogenase subunit alpha